MSTMIGIRDPKIKLRSSLHISKNHYKRSIEIDKVKESIDAFLDWVSDIVEMTNKPAQILLQNNLTKDLMSVSVSLENGRTFGGYSSTFLGAFRKTSREMYRYWEQKRLGIKQ